MERVQGARLDVQAAAGSVRVRDLYADTSRVQMGAGSVHLGNCHRDAEVKIHGQGQLSVGRSILFVLLAVLYFGRAAVLQCKQSGHFAQADPGKAGGLGPTCPTSPQEFFQNHAVSGNLKQILGSGPPWGQNSTGQPKSWIHPCY